MKTHLGPRKIPVNRGDLNQLRSTFLNAWSASPLLKEPMRRRVAVKDLLIKGVLPYQEGKSTYPPFKGDIPRVGDEKKKGKPDCSST